jgi:hypothetical protein
MATQVQKVGGITAVVGPRCGFCEHNEQVHRLVDVFAARAGLGAEAEAEAETGLDSNPAAAYERIRHGATTMDLFTRTCPLSTRAPTTPRSRWSCGVVTSDGGVWRATSPSPLPLGGGLLRVNPPPPPHHWVIASRNLTNASRQWNRRLVGSG